jgi:uncharacterized protein
MSPDQARTLIVGFTDWAQEQRTCRALAIVGSWARNAGRPTSDLDLLILTTDLSKWTTRAGWLSELVRHLGFSCRDAVLEARGVAKSWRASLGRDVELERTFAELSWANIFPVDPGTRRVVCDGIRPFVDKDGLLRALTEVVRKVI